MKFDVVIGNPPYQEDLKNTSDRPIYNNFMDAAYQLADRVELITPARFLFNAGKTQKKWNKKMLTDENLKVIRYEKESKNIFPGTNINGGIVITYRDATKKYGAINYFCLNSAVKTVIEKVVNSKNFCSIKTFVYPQNKFNLEELYKDYYLAKSKISSSGNEKRIVSSAFDNLTEVFSNVSTSKDDVQICGLSDRKRIFKYINKKYLDSDSNIDTYKVLLSAADGASGIIGNPVPARIIGKPVILNAGIGYTQTFISIGAFDNRQYAHNLKQYLLTKFARFMVGTIKATNGLKIEVWSNVPLQDFTSNSDIDWSKSIHEIDLQLYKKYGLDDNEINFIETHVKEME